MDISQFFQNQKGINLWSNFTGMCQKEEKKMPII
jgi:hypothetical protein